MGRCGGVWGYHVLKKLYYSIGWVNGMGWGWGYRVLNKSITCNWMYGMRGWGYYVLEKLCHSIGCKGWGGVGDGDDLY